MKFLKHPQHGFKHATDAEATADALNGWVDAESMESGLDESQDDDYGDEAASAPSAGVQSDLLPIAHPAKRGRKPKHRG